MAGKRISPALCRLLETGRKSALNALDKHMSDLGTWQMPKGGFYIWVKLGRAVSMKKLFKLAARSHILINPGEIYDFGNNLYIRISYAFANTSDLEYGIEKLSNIIRKMG
jgi:GntR family transcriptional regulator of abcA and norABC